MSKTRLQLSWYNKDRALIPTEQGKYGYTWVDPSDPRYCETHALIYDEYILGKQSPKTEGVTYSELADLEPQSDNLMILGESGDVLETLTRVPEIANKYVGKVKLVYIDPPFNTAKAFVAYEDNLEHSIWLTMMRDRLLHLKKLLRSDGVIFVHLDDVEVHRMRLLMDEVFGSNNFISEIAWEKTFKPRNDAKMVSGRHDILLVYRKTDKFLFGKLPRTDEMNKAYTNPDNDENGPWTSAPVTATGSADHQGMVFGVQHPITGEIVYPPAGQHWRMGQDSFLKTMKGWNSHYVLEDINDVAKRAELCGIGVDDVRKDVKAIIIPAFDSTEALHVYDRGQWPTVYITSNGQGGFRKKTFLRDMEGRTIEDIWFQDEVGSNDEAKNEIKSLFPDEPPFDTPKPERLLERIIHISTKPGDIVLDCFAGSGTTAAVSQKMGRRWVTCELIESSFDRYVKTRLTKVVNDEDDGGISKTQGVRIVAEDVDLPDGVTPDDLFKFNSVLNKVISADDELKKDKIIKILKAKTKTTKLKETINWRGGGGFQVAHLSPACFDYDTMLNRVVLTPLATGQTLVKSISANLGFKLLNDERANTFDARRGNTLLKVIEGVVGQNVVDWLVPQLNPSETLIIAALSVPDGVREYLRKQSRGSRIIAIPDDIFSYQIGGKE